MALKGSKSVSLSFQSMVGDQVAIYMSAQIPENGKSNSNMTIQDLELYEANKTECRNDMNEFQSMLWELEDQNAKQEEGQGTDEEAGTEELA